jgi:hypothetical protein
MPRILASLAAAIAFGLFAHAAEAKPKDGGGPAQPNGVDPCATGQAVGNPCNGNNGNDKGVGNANKDEPPPGWCGDLPGCREEEGAGEAPQGQGPGGAYIIQIGDDNTAEVDQTAADSDSHATIRQSGDSNAAVIRQAGRGGFAELLQSGDGHFAQADQSGASSLLAAQTGAGHDASVSQAGVNAAFIAQQGVGNEVTLVQNGDDNDAVLAQNGTGNLMSATQNGSGNKLAWTQQGDALPDLNVTQTGSMAVTITQTNAP